LGEKAKDVFQIIERSKMDKKSLMRTISRIEIYARVLVDKDIATKMGKEMREAIEKMELD